MLFCSVCSFHLLAIVNNALHSPFLLQQTASHYRSSYLTRHPLQLDKLGNFDPRNNVIENATWLDTPESEDPVFPDFNVQPTQTKLPKKSTFQRRTMQSLEFFDAATILNLREDRLPLVTKINDHYCPDAEDDGSYSYGDPYCTVAADDPSVKFGKKGELSIGALVLKSDIPVTANSAKTKVFLSMAEDGSVSQTIYFNYFYHFTYTNCRLVLLRFIMLTILLPARNVKRPRHGLVLHWKVMK